MNHAYYSIEMIQMQNDTACRDECPNSQYCHSPYNGPCPKSGDYMDCCDYWRFEEWRDEARREKADMDREEYDEEEDEE